MATATASTPTSKNSEDDFLRVLEEMNRLCGDPEEASENKEDEDDIFASTKVKTSAAPLIGDQLLSSASALGTSANRKNRSRHCSANSAKSCVSFDSAIGDVYSVQTPTKMNKNSSHHNELDIFDFSPNTTASTSTSSTSPSTVLATKNVGEQFDNLAASVCFDSGEPSADLLEFDTSKDVDGLGGISLRLVGSEDLVSTSFSLAINSDTSLPSSSPKPLPISSKKRPLNTSEVNEIEYLCRKKHRINVSSSSVIVKEKPPTPLSPQLLQERQEVERICLDLLRRFQNACNLHPKTQAKVWKSGGCEDPLLITTRLISDSLARLRIFVHSLDPMNWLIWPDRQFLYCNNVCILSVFKAAVSVNLEAVPMAYPLPYGEYLGEVEALHLILAHDLYNELRALLSHIQSLGIREFPVMLLVMMIAFFSPQPGLKQPDKVVRVNDYYMHKLQIYLHLRFGPDAMVNLMTKILSTVERVRSFSLRLREFLNDVTQSGLQKQFESVCENIGLIAFLLQTEPKYDQC